MKASLRPFAALSVIVCLTLACATVTQPLGLGAPTDIVRVATAAPRLSTELAGAGAELATQVAATLEAQLGDSGASDLATQAAATIEAALQTTPKATAKPGAKPAPTAKPGATAPSAPAVDVDAGIRVANGLSILLGDQADAETLPSYHLEVKLLWPVLSGSKVVQREELLSADVEGANLHLTKTATEPGGKPEVYEGYVIGDNTYEVKNGKATPDFGMAAVTWSTWPINAFFVFSIGSLQAVAEGAETLDGRAAEVYTLGGTLADDPTGALSALGLPVSEVKGQVWIDQATGALLQARLDYKALPSDSQEPSPGRLEITVSQIGSVTVSDPTK